MRKTKLFILAVTYWQISFEKYVPFPTIPLDYCMIFILFFRRRYLLILKNYSENVSNPKVRVCAQTQDLHFFKKFICLKWIQKKLSTTLHTQLNSLHSRSLPLTRKIKIT